MSQTVVAYIVSLAILAAMALFIPLIEWIARMLRTPFDEQSPLSERRPVKSSFDFKAAGTRLEGERTRVRNR